MADDSDIDSWYLKQDEFVKSPKINYTLPVSHNGLSGLSNGHQSLPCYNQTKQTSSRPGTEVRFINPAIYAESLAPSNDCQEPTPSTYTDEEASLIVEVRCGDSNDLARGLSALSIDEKSARSGRGDDPGNNYDQATADTYRCSRSNTSRTSTLTLTNDSKSVTRLIRRCAINGSSKICANNGEEEDVRRFSLNGRRVVQFSSTSLSSSAFSDIKTSGVALARKIAHEEWVQRKQRAAQEKFEAERREDLRRRAEEEEIEKQRLEREWKERENFLRWQERKKKEEANRRHAVERELDLQRRLKAVEDRAAIAKIIHLQQWARKKEDAQKAQQKEQELRRKAIEEERKKRLDESTQAFEKWRESAKSKPRPATQGLLPHQRAKPSFVNPKPWQKIVEENPDESLQQENFSSKKIMGQGKTNARKSIASQQ